MSTRAILKRINLMVDEVARGCYPTKAELIAKMECSPRTFDRTLEILRDEFGHEITYDTKRRGYYLDHENSMNIPSFQRLLAVTGVVNAIHASAVEDTGILKNVEFEYEGVIKGSQHIGPLLRAIKGCQKVKLIHKKFQADEPQQYTVYPSLLKEHQGRWYLVAYAEERNDYRTFGLDRVKQLNLMDEVFESDEVMTSSTYFKDVVGLVFSNNDLTDVVIRVNAEQVPYIKSLPLHRSQMELSKDENGMTIQISVHPNFELDQKIMAMGSRAEVLEPKWYRKEIKKELRKAIGGYDD